MTDNEILKVLECCHNGTCSMCPYVNEGYCGRRMISGSLDLIKRQQAEIERLNECEKISSEAYEKLLYEVDAAPQKARAEAIKEFADKLKANLSFGKYITGEQIDSLVKELVGADDV